MSVPVGDSPAVSPTAGAAAAEDAPAAPPPEAPDPSPAAIVGVAPPRVEDEEFSRAMGLSVFLIEVLGEDDRVESEGTAFCVGPSRVMTAWHVVRHARNARIRTDGGETHPVQGLLAGGEENDLAVLLVDIPAEELRPLSLATDPPIAGRRICVVGGPFVPGGGCSPSYGVVLGESLDPTLFRIRVPAAPGWSGSPVLDERGAVVGVACGSTGPTTLAADVGAARSVVQSATRAVPVPLSTASPRGVYGRDEEADGPGKRVPPWLRPAVEALLRGDFDGAEKLLRGILRDHGTESDAWEVLAVVEWKRGRREAAIDALRSVRDLRFEESSAWQALGNALSQTGRHREAVEALRGAVARDPQDRDALYGLGYSCDALGLWDEAIESWSRVLEIDPTYAAAQQGIDHARAMRSKR